MSPKKFHKKEMLIVLFVLLGANSSWHFMEDSHQNQFQAQKQKTIGMVEFAATAQDALPKERTTRFGRWFDWAIYGDDEGTAVQVADATPAAEETKVKAEAPKDSNVDRKFERSLEVGKDRVKHKVSFQNIEAQGSKFTLATVGDIDAAKAGTEGTSCDQLCGEKVWIKDHFDPNSLDSMAAFAKQLEENLKDKPNKKDETVANNSGDSEEVEVTETKVAADSGEQKKKPEASERARANQGDGKKDTTENAAAKADDKEGDEEEFTEEEIKAKAIADKCEPHRGKDNPTSFLNCMNRQIKAFVKKEKDSSVKVDVIEELYSSSIKEKLTDLLESESERDRNKGLDLAKEFMRAIPQKKFPSIIKEIRTKVVAIESKKLNSELLTEINEKANDAALAFNEYQVAMKSMSPDTWRLGEIYKDKMNKLDILGSKYLMLGQKGKNSELFDRLSPFFEGADGELQLNNLVYGLYQGATAYKNKLYSTLSSNKPITDLIAEDLVTPDFSSGKIVVDLNNSGLAGGATDLLGGASGNRMARDNGGFNRGGLNSVSGLNARAGISNYPGNYIGQGAMRVGPQYSSINPISQYQPSILSGNSNSPFYNWGSVRPDPSLGNLNYLYNNTNYNSRPYTGGNSTWGYPGNTSTNWGPQYQWNGSAGNYGGQQNCYYSSLTPLNNNCGNSYQYPNSGYRTGYTNGTIGGGRFGY